MKTQNYTPPLAETVLLRQEENFCASAEFDSKENTEILKYQDFDELFPPIVG